MPVETDAERALFLDPDDFGVEALYTPRNGGQARTIAGLFDRPGTDWNPNRWPGHEYQMQEGAHIASTAPTFLARSADLVKGGKRRDLLDVAGEGTFRVVKAAPDGTGMVLLTLEGVEDGDEVEP